MWTTTITHRHGEDKDQVVGITHDFGNQVTVVTNFEERTTKVMHGSITVNEIDMIKHTEQYAQFLNNIDNEYNLKK